MGREVLHKSSRLRDIWSPQRKCYSETTTSKIDWQVTHFKEWKNLLGTWPYLRMANWGGLSAILRFQDEDDQKLYSFCVCAPILCVCDSFFVCFYSILCVFFYFVCSIFHFMCFYSILCVSDSILCVCSPLVEAHSLLSHPASCTPPTWNPSSNRQNYPQTQTSY